MTNIENWDNKEFVLEAVKVSGGDLRFASDELKNDKEVVLQAVRRDGEALEYASYELKNDKEVVLEALQQLKFPFSYTCEVMQYIGNELGKELLELTIEHLKK